jgi:tetratricopeptide (TPR) repeat protein
MKKNIISFILSITFFIFLSCKTTDIIPGSNRIKIQNIYNEYLNIANVYYELEKFDKAIEYYTLAMDSKELYWACYYKLAQCYALTSKWTQSEEYYVVLQERDPTNSSIKHL